MGIGGHRGLQGGGRGRHDGRSSCTGVRDANSQRADGGLAEEEAGPKVSVNRRLDKTAASGLKAIRSLLHQTTVTVSPPAHLGRPEPKSKCLLVDLFLPFLGKESR